jgi:hypothetical protein
MKVVKLSKGNHPRPFEGETPTMCAQEFASYLAGEPHSDSPKCVSPVLNRFMVSFNDSLDDEQRQRLRPYIVRTLGTAGDGQDGARSYMALDWLIRVHTPAFLAAAGLTEEAEKLRGLAAIEGIEQARAATPCVTAAGAAAWAAAGDAAGAAARDAAWAAAGDAAWDAAGAAAWDAARAAAWDAARAAAWDALQSTVSALQSSAFNLLERMLDPSGMHDVPTEDELFQRSGREALTHVSA